MAEQRGADGGGLFASLKALSANLLGTLQTRLELLAVDVAEERARLTTLLALVLVSLFSLGVGVVLLALLIVVALWESHRLVALAALISFFLVTGVAVGWLAIYRLRNSPRLFDASIAELAKDREQLEP
jgi:uncharacterized membrane protein YqjE